MDFLLNATGSTSAFLSSSQLADSSTVSLRDFSTTSGNISQDAFHVLCFLVGLIGSLANIIVLFVLYRFGRTGKNATNRFILNQTTIDTTGCLALTVCVIVQWLAGSTGVGSGVKGWFRCLLVDSTVPVLFSASASQFGLIVITLERYAMVVHPVEHRKHFRPWMIRVGVIVPWLDGLFVIVIPNWATTRVIGGLCLSNVYWPSVAAARFYITFVFVWQFVVTIAVVVFCYARIIVTIRHQMLTVTARKPVNSTAAESTAAPVSPVPGNLISRSSE
jgi:hypothetical protein